MKHKLLSIGELSKLTGSSIKSLRYYDSINLLKPHYINPDNHYRYYLFEQVRIVNLIQICLNLGIPLQTVRDLALKDGQTIHYDELISSSRQSIKDQIEMLQDNLNLLDIWQTDIQRLSSYQIQESIVEYMDKRYYYLLPLDTAEMDASYYQSLNHLYEECLSNKIRVTHDIALIIISHRDYLSSFVAVRIHDYSRTLPQILEIREGLYLCKKTNEENFANIVQICSADNPQSRIIIVTPAFERDIASPKYEIQCYVDK